MLKRSWMVKLRKTEKSKLLVPGPRPARRASVPNLISLHALRIGRRARFSKGRRIEPAVGAAVRQIHGLSQHEIGDVEGRKQLIGRRDSRAANIGREAA